MRTLALAATVMWATVGQAAHTAPGNSFGGDAGPPDAFTVIDGTVRTCAGKPGTTCWAAGARTTVAVASEPVAAHATASKLPVVPRFARAASGEARGEPSAWTIELSAVLKRPTWPGNLIVMMVDTDDPQAVQARQFTGLYQASVKALKVLDARLVLSPDEGYRAGHTYHALVIQLIDGKEILLAEGEVTLL